MLMPTLTFMIMSMLMLMSVLVFMSMVMRVCKSGIDCHNLELAKLLEPYQND